VNCRILTKPFAERKKLVLAISKNMVYNTQAPAGVMGSEGSAAGGRRSDPSEWPRSVCNAAA
ncbi:MAG: hypothetical protein J6B67_03580, partial [Oscillospiraceae bacterium]|nr:hypothetical protein [Oscillospiraceae bacterium]